MSDNADDGEIAGPSSQAAGVRRRRNATWIAAEYDYDNMSCKYLFMLSVMTPVSLTPHCPQCFSPLTTKLFLNTSNIPTSMVY